MNPRILSTSAIRSLRSLTPLTTTAGIHTAFPVSFAYPTTNSTSANSVSHGTPTNSAPSTPPVFQTHSTDVYSKEVDSSPPENTKLHSINPEAEIENPSASFASAPSEDGSRAEVFPDECQRVNAFSHPYAVPG